MMKTRSFLLLPGFLGILVSCNPVERDCAQFKTGTFESETFLNGELVKSKSVRNDSMEIDYFMGKSDTSMIRWINDCEYIGTKLHPKSRNDQKPLHIKILTTDDAVFTFEYGYVGDKKNKQKGTAKKIN